MSALITVSNLEKFYGDEKNSNKVIDNVSFEVERGEFIGIMGPSGSGKTTLLNLLSTIDQATAGHIFYEKDEITSMNDDEAADFRKNNLGFVFQDFNLLDTLTIEENIILALSLNRVEKAEIIRKVDYVIKNLGIDDIRNKFPYQVSGGQKQRCACARALINDPKLILADEPTGALDSKSSQTLLQSFAIMNESMNTTILMVTHDAFSASYCKRILFLKDGKIFHELQKMNRKRKAFLNEILDILSLNGGEDTDVI